MEKILTISIAAHNVEKYIDEALRSIVDERIIDDLEVFVVDDGGSDKTLELAKQYETKYPNSIFLVHKENGGYGSTVNYSIEHATGKFFKLLDGDDWFNRDGFYQLVEALKKISADVVITNYCYGSSIDDLRIKSISGVEKEKNLEISELCYDRCFVNPEITYRTAILKELNIRLPLHTLYTDIIYISEPFMKASTLYYLDSLVYCYRKGYGEQSVNKEAVKRHLEEQFYVTECACQYVADSKKKGNKNLNYQIEAACFSYMVGCRWFIKYIPFSFKSLKRFKQYNLKIKSISDDVYCYVKKKEKFGAILWLIRKSNYLLYIPIKIAYILNETLEDLLLKNR